MAINEFPSRRASLVNKGTSRRDGGINNNQTTGRRSEPRVAGEPPSPTCPNPTFERNFGDGRHSKVGVPKSTRHGYMRASHHHDYMTSKDK